MVGRVKVRLKVNMKDRVVKDNVICNKDLTPGHLIAKDFLCCQSKPIGRPCKG